MFKENLFFSFFILVAVLIFLSLGLIFFYAPEEANQGLVQKTFYFHVGSALAMYVGYGFAALGALLFFIRKKPQHICLAHAGCDVGLIFNIMVLLSGMFWAKPIWFTFWTWEPRLITTTIMFMIFLVSFLIRKITPTPFKPNSFSLIGLVYILGSFNIPLVYFSVKLWRGVHPQVLGKTESMPSSMRITLIFSMVALMLLAAFWTWLRSSYYRALVQSEYAIPKK